MEGELQTLLPRAYYVASVDAFLSTIPDNILGILTINSDFSVELSQRNAWCEQIKILKDSLRGLSGTLFLEFNIPRMGRRIDAVLIAGTAIFVIEFKVGENEFSREALDQVWDYALDLKNFHEASHSAAILPILVSTEAEISDANLPISYEDGVFPPMRSSSDGLREIINLGLKNINGNLLDGIRWGAASYHPTPTIIEAAQALYAQHSVEAIARHDAGARNLLMTSRRIGEVIDKTRREKQKAICFVTGVPGAGKTLVGLNLATTRRDPKQPTHSVFLSGNGPLVMVLREALTRDEVNRRRAQGEHVRKGRVGESVKVFIQNVHHFRDEALRDSGPPIDHVVIFDEAQRAWNKDQTAKFMQTKKKRINFAQSEPEFLISYLNRHRDWAVVVCLVGGGQEINTGEAGIGAWIDAINQFFPEWHIYISPELKDSEYAAGHALDAIRERLGVNFDDALHLAVSMRSFRAENVSAFVKALLDCDSEKARDSFNKLRHRYPIALTRNLNRARQWIKSHARGSERYGLVASSEGQRLKPHAIDVRVNINPVHWFLNDKNDTRSSYYLEDAASQFDIQGLELDWVCISWDGDLRFKEGEWAFHSFCGSRWNNINNKDRQNYLLNAYRVLLTRARQGMIIFLPEGVPEDPTRNPKYYDQTFRYLSNLGIPVVV